MRRILLFLLMLVLTLAGHGLRAQERTISGTVAGADGTSIPGVTVMVKGGKVGTSTDADGKYSLAVPAKATTLIYSYVGYENKVVPIGNQSTINVDPDSSAPRAWKKWWWWATAPSCAAT